VTAASGDSPEGAAEGLDFAPPDLYVFHPESKTTLCHGILCGTANGERPSI
jgi:hypothetical protein